MRTFRALAFALLLSWAVTPLSAACAQRADRISVCASPAAALQAAQSGAAAAPDGCHTVLIRRVDTQAGPVCQVDFSPNVQGSPGPIVDSVVPLQWWIACGAGHSSIGARAARPSLTRSRRATARLSAGGNAALFGNQ